MPVVQMGGTQLPRPLIRPSAVDLAKTIKVFDFFSGCGGTSAGMRSAGMEIVVGLDNDADAANTYRANFPEAKFISADIRRLPTRRLDSLVAKCEDHPILFCACAPCQPFSKHLRLRQEPGDKRLGLLSQLTRFIKRYRPELLFVENVPGLQGGGLQSGAFDRFVHGLNKLGFRAKWRTVRAEQFGVPQRRARLVLLASAIGDIDFPGLTHGPNTINPTYSPIREWVGDLPALAAGEEHPSVPNHRAAALSQLNLARIRATPEGGGWKDWPDELVPECHKGTFEGYSDVYGRMRWDTPATGLTTRCISYSNGRFGHPSQDRAITVREAARIQTFSDDFVLTGSLSAQARQVGNAVPVLLAQRFGAQFIQHVATRRANP